MKSLNLLALVFMAGLATAGETCNVHINAGLRVSPELLEFYQHDKAVYQIKAGQYLVRNGTELNLDSTQRALVAQYDQQIRSLVPEIRSMALEGVELAIFGVTTAFDELLGERNKISTQLRSELNHLKGDVSRYFENDIIGVGRDQDAAPEVFGKYFETRMERIMETSVQDSMGAIMVAMGKEMISSGGNMDALGARMNRFGKTLEAQMQTQAAKLETSGIRVCQAITAVNAVEDKLRSTVPDIRALDLLRLSAAETEKAVEM